ncbi:MAG: hypothetical protein QM811_20500 [Pirellulales bacterium]
MPPGLAKAIALNWFDKNPANKAALGGYMFVSKTDSIDAAREALQEAQQGGIDTKGMIELSKKPGLDKK